MVEKRVDESWKENVEKEQNKAPETKPAEEPVNITPDKQEMPPANFILFISGLGMQALMGLGEIENPATNKKEVDLEQAKYLIDVIEMLQEKTKGNLIDEEAKAIDQMLYELRSKHISLSK